MTPEDVTEDRLLGGRVAYTQPRTGFRTGIEPVLLAAAIPARTGQAVLEAGTGAGAAMLCLAWRAPGCRIVAVEADPDLAAMAECNLRRNGFSGHHVAQGDLFDSELLSSGAVEAPSAGFHHAMANPPWHEAHGTRSPLPRRERAKRGDPTLYARWAVALGSRLRPRGTLSLVLPAAHLADGLAALTAAGCGGATMLPLWPRVGRDARLVILRGVRGARGACRVASGLILHGPDGYTEAAAAILYGGGALPPEPGSS